MKIDPTGWTSLGLMVGATVCLLCLLICIHDLPHEIARERGHPHRHAIYASSWISLAMLHVLGPLILLWALSHKSRKTFTGIPSSTQPHP